MNRLREINTLGNANKKFLREQYGYKTIRSAYADFGVNNANDAYEALMDSWNNYVEIEKANRVRAKKEAERKKKMEKKMNEALLYENSLILDSNYYNKGINYKAPSIELRKAQQLFKKDKNVLYQFKIEFYDNNGNKLDNVTKLLKIKILDGVDVFEFTFKTEVFDTNKITDEFIRRINMNLSKDSKLYFVPDLLLSAYPNGYTKLTTKVFRPFKNNKVAQVYKDNDTGTCVYDGVVKYFENKQSNKNAKAILNKLIKNKDTLAKPYTEEQIRDELAPFCQSSITLKNLINGKDTVLNESTFNRFNIEFMNTKFNHLDLLTHTYNEVQNVNRDEYFNLKQQLPFYIEKYGKLYTLDKVYHKEDNKFQAVFKNWKNNNGYENYYIHTDTDEYKMLENYDYKLHTFFNDFEINDKLYKEVDLKKAYYNYSNSTYNRFYSGIPSGSFINVCCNEKFDFNEITNNGFVGFYQIQIIDSNLDRRLGLTNGSIHYLFTSMIKLLLENNVKIKFLNASYSVSVDIPFTSDFLEKENDIKHYCKAFGLMLSETSVIDINVKPLVCDIDYFNTICDENLNMYKDDNIIKLQYANKKTKSYIHIGYAIHAYTQTLILEQLIKMDMDKVFGVKLDSIVLKNDYNFEFPSIFDNKEANITSMLKMAKSLQDEDDDDIQGYYRNYIASYSKENLNFKKPFFQNGDYVTKRVVFIGGKGGSGKTYSCLNFMNLFNTCYSTMCWNLIQGKMIDAKNLMGHSIPQLTGGEGNAKCEKIQNTKIRNIILDEATLLNKNEILKIVEEYKHCFIYILGDIDEDGFYYQCSVTNNVINPSLYDFQYNKYTTSYRFDAELDNKLNILRDVMKKERKINLNYHMTEIIKCVKKEFANNFKSIDDVVFNDDDIGICCKDDFKRGNELTEYFINKGAKPRYFVKTTNKQTGMMRGRELHEKPSHNNYECKLFKTIHSFQGLDLNNDNKIIIVLDCLFDVNLLYTALSRARRCEQIVLIEV